MNEQAVNWFQPLMPKHLWNDLQGAYLGMRVSVNWKY